MTNANRCSPARCPLCKAGIEVQECVSFGDESLWWGACPEQGPQVEGETPERVRAEKHAEGGLSNEPDS